MSSHIKKESPDWMPLTMDRAVDQKAKLLIIKPSKVKVDHLTRIDRFDAWLIAITRALRSVGLGEAYLSHEGRASSCRLSTEERWMAVSKQIASWMQHHVDDTLIGVLRTRGKILPARTHLLTKQRKCSSQGLLQMSAE
ncbi:hypothetical protein N7451_009244 [Penicillium sp. IBT 35674x]|nr:hypothetical protein N7451_009244 [Penicillium sp. IBT 35674x]